MKSILLQAMLMFLLMGTAYSQIEDFEDEANGAKSFTVGGVSFTTTGDLKVEIVTGFGCNNSDAYLATGLKDGGTTGSSFGSIKVTNPGDKFTLSTSLPWCSYLSANDGNNGIDGDIKFTGTLLNGETIKEIFRVIDAQGAFTPITFSADIWGGQELTALEATKVSDFNYLALDNIAFENLLTTGIATIQEEEIKIFPNPTAGEINIIGIDDAEVIIMDAFGRIVKNQPLLNQKMDISDLLVGIYFISINTHDQQITKRIIKL